MTPPPGAALLRGGAIGAPGGLMGPGGAAFRRPVLPGALALVAHASVRLWRAGAARVAAGRAAVGA